MKVVNQSIGRALRHKNDFSCILLFDERFSRPSLKNKLSDWAKLNYSSVNGEEPEVLQLKINRFFQKLLG